MNISLKELIGKNVYKDENGDPWGKVKGVCFADEGSKICSVMVESLSLIPLSCVIPIKEILDTGDKKLILRSEISIGKRNEGLTTDNQISGAVCKNGKCGRIKDMRFDFETGEITDIIIRKSVFGKGEKVCVNKTYIKNGSIYIE